MNIHGKDIKIFACSSNRPLAEAIAKDLGLPLGDAEMGIFSDGEISCTINESVRGSEVFVIQSTSSPVNNNLMELLILIDALKRASASCITAVIPYFGYARQDRKAKSRDPISAKLVANLIATAGADRVLTMDLHSPQIQGFFDIPLDNLQGVSILAPYFKNRFLEQEGQEKNFVCLSPDVGSVARVRNFASRIGVGFAIIDKRRQKANVCEVMNIIGDVKDKTVLIIDDMVDTAGTLCNAAKAVVETGGAKEVYACASHGVLSGPAVERIKNSNLKELILLDTIKIPQEKLIDKIQLLPTHGIFAQAIDRIFNDKPISILF